MTTDAIMTGKVALISGGARGQGASHAKAIVEQGGQVVIGDVLDSEGELTAKELGDDVVYTHLDVTSETDWQAAVDLAVATFGKLNVLVNNAGILQYSSLEDYTLDKWNRIIAINLTGVFLGCRTAAPELIKAAPSAIVNISSAAGLNGGPEMHGYVASKFGVRGLTKTVAAELGPHGVRCNSIHPGMIWTPMVAELAGADVSASPGAAPGVLGRVGTPEDVSNMVLFLASEMSGYSTGSEFVIDAGYGLMPPNG